MYNAFCNPAFLPTVLGRILDADNSVRKESKAPATNVLETETDYRVEFAAPGLCKEDFSININADGDLIIKMENHNKAKDEKEKVYLRREFSPVDYEQALILPEDVDKSSIKAHVADGVLTIILPKMVKEDKKVVRQIAID